MEILITGTGRCGTVYAARLLNSCGVNCGHESIFNIGGLEEARFLWNNKNHINISDISKDEMWIKPSDIQKIQADSSYMAAPFLECDLLRNAKIIHLIRNPMLIVSSFVKDFHYFQSSSPSNVYEEFIYQHVPDLKEEMHPIKRTTLYVSLWNSMIEQSSRSVLCKVEDGGIDLLRKASIKPRESMYANSKANSRSTGNRLTLDEFYSAGAGDEIENLMKKYKYST